MQLFQKWRHHRQALGGRLSRKKAKMPNPRRLLPISRGHERQQAEKHKAERQSAPHSITSSARPRIVGGISTPIVRAVRWFSTSSNLVGCSAGVSAGHAPFSILSVKLAAIA